MTDSTAATSRPSNNASAGRNIVLRLGARGSLLSRLQSRMVARALEAAHPKVCVELVVITTSGDQIQDRQLHEFGGKGLFTKELEQALLRREVDFAVHSFKDVPVTMPLVDTTELLMAAIPARADCRDVLACGGARDLMQLPAGARVGTGSLRRQAQILSMRPDLQVLPIRGNVDTRVGKLKSGQYDAVILAMAGLQRSGLFDPALMTAIETEQMLPAAGQGALALQCRRDAVQVRELLASLHDPATALCAELERRVVRELEGDCHSPIGALAQRTATGVRLQAIVARRDGQPPVLRAEVQADMETADRAVTTVVERLKKEGAMELLAGGQL